MNKQKFLEAVEDFIKKNDVSDTAFGMKAAGESNFVFELRKGRECREDKRNQVLDFMANYKKHPLAISRPRKRRPANARAA